MKTRQKNHPTLLSPRHSIESVDNVFDCANLMENFGSEETLFKNLTSDKWRSIIGYLIVGLLAALLLAAILPKVVQICLNRSELSAVEEENLVRLNQLPHAL